MGMCVYKLYFENGIPSMADVRIQFEKQTGLNLGITVGVNLLTLTTDSRTLIEKASEDIDRYEHFLKNEMKGSLERISERMQKINYIDGFQFHCYGFPSIDFLIDDQTIALSYLRGRFYFPTSLNKCLFDLGGKFLELNGELMDDLELLQGRWKRLKHWEKYKWYNRPNR